jgi:hypothetical protein
LEKRGIIMDIAEEIDMAKIKDFPDIAELLRVELGALAKVYAGNNLPFTIKVKLADKYKKQPEKLEKLWEIIEANRDWFGVLEIKIKDDEKFNNITNSFFYATEKQIFEGGGYIYKGTIKAPKDKGELTLVARIQTKEYGGNSPWEPPYIDTKKIKIL